MTQCRPLNSLDGTTGEHLLRNIVSNAAVYHECVDKHKMLIEAVESQHKK